MLDYMRIMINARLAKMDERGASAVEYGLLVAGIAAVIVAIVFLLGGTLSGVFDKTNSSETGTFATKTTLCHGSCADSPQQSLRKLQGFVRTIGR